LSVTIEEILSAAQEGFSLTPKGRTLPNMAWKQCEQQSRSYCAVPGSEEGRGRVIISGAMKKAARGSLFQIFRGRNSTWTLIGPSFSNSQVP
jgi:hypothetical protein